MSSTHDRSLYDDAPRSRDAELPEYRRGLAQERAGDREISLGIGTILGIFFGLALVCAVFFGFGYSMGRKSSQPSVAVAEGSPSGGIFSSFKPAAGSPVTKAVQTAGKTAAETTSQTADNSETQYSSPAARESAPSVPQSQAGTTTATSATKGSLTPASDETSVPVIARTPPRAAPAAAVQAAPVNAMPAITSNGTIMVQIAAVSHQEDAEVLLSALKQRGYAVIVRQEAQDRLMHVQVGPFATRKDADIMRQRLLADGYNAIIK